MKISKFTLVAVLLVAVLTACGQQAASTPSSTPATTSPATKATPTATPTPTAASPTSKPAMSTTAATTITLKWPVHLAENHFTSRDVLIPFAKELETKTNGRVKVNFFWSESLAKGSEEINLLSQGAVDIIYVPVTLVANRFPLSEAISLPFLSTDATQGSKVLWELAKKGYFDKEYAEFKLVSLAASAPTHIVSKKPVQSLADLNGLKIRNVGASDAKLLSGVGASPVSMAGGEVYLSLDKGVVDGAVWSYSGAAGWKAQEIVKYVYECGIMSSPLIWIMNRNSFAKLPSDVQAMFPQFGDDIAAMTAASYAQYDDNAKTLFIQAGAQISSLSAADRAKWMDIASPMYNDWVTATEGKGYTQAKTVVQLLQQAVK